MSNLPRRGIFLPPAKEPAASRAIETLKTPGRIYLPISAGHDTAVHPAAGLYDTVRCGDVLIEPENSDDTPVLATVSGVLAETMPVNHPQLGELTCAVIDQVVMDLPPQAEPRDIRSLAPDEIVEIARLAGIIDEIDGMPLHRRLRAFRTASIQLAAADATDSEPYTSSGWVVLNENAEQVLEGLSLAARAAGAPAYHVAVQLPAARRRPIIQRLGEEHVYQVGRRYPVDRFGKSGDQPVGRIGVQACLALYQAAAYGIPHRDCVITVAGDAVANPQNVRVPFGTLVEDILAFCGLAKNPAYVLLGDVMTGVTVSDTKLPIIPGNTCLLAMTSRKTVPFHPCIGCGRCAQVCHAGLLPYEIIRRLENMHYERLTSLHPEECDGCGACSAVCPAGREVAQRVLEAGEAHSTILLDWRDEDDV
ncbi:MAG: 4Fe-4S dicluster domain-containing protein [Acutalibacteraceae bacterium]